MLNEAAYWQQYGLPHDPFADGGEAGYFSVPQWQQEIDLMRHMVQFSDVLMTVTGEAGVGKSVFAQQFLQKLDPAVQVLQMDATQRPLDGAALLDELRSAFQLPAPTEDNLTLKEHIEYTVDQLLQSDHSYLLLVDNAHELPQLTLATVLNLVKLQAVSHQSTNLHIVLISEPSLLTSLQAMKAATEVEGKSIIHHSQLQPLVLEQISQYLEFRLNIAGYTDILPFNHVDLERIRKVSSGLIGNINRQAREILEEKLMVKSTRSPSLLSRYRGALMMGTAAAFIATFAFGGLMWLKNPGQELTETATVELTLPPLEWQDNELIEVDDPVVLAELIDETTPEVATDIVVSVQPTVAANNETIAVKAAIEEPVLQTPVVETVAPIAPPPAKKVVAPTVSLNQEPTDAERAQALRDVRKSYSQPKKPAVVLDKVVVIPEVKPAAKPPQPKAVPPAVVRTTADTVKTLPEQYALQILGSANLAKVQSFVQQHDFTTQVRIYQLERQNKPWYVVVYGAYDTSANARAAIAKLPQSVQNLQPWPRALADLKQAKSINRT